MPDDRGFDFRSDNVAGLAPEVMEALIRANAGADSSYGEDETTARVAARLAELFEHDLSFFPVATGSAANALALASIVPGWGAILCHPEAHVATDECGAPELFTQGAKLVPVPGRHGKIDGETVRRHLARASRGVHHVQPAAISISQSTESGTCYRPDEIAAIAAAGHAHGLRLHLDGARLANALASLGCTPADTTWRAGVDVVSLGLTKNGALAAEAVIFFDPALARDFAFRRKRSGHLFSKMRFVSAQFEAQLADGAWLRHAAHANAMAQRLAAGLKPIPEIGLLHPVEANEVFVRLPERIVAGLEAAGYRFYRWDSEPAPAIRLVTAFDTRPDAVDRLIDAVRIAIGLQ